MQLGGKPSDAMRALPSAIENHHDTSGIPQRQATRMPICHYAMQSETVPLAVAGV